jgi:hypothetical protein
MWLAMFEWTPWILMLFLFCPNLLLYPVKTIIWFKETVFWQFLLQMLTELCFWVRFCYKMGKTARAMCDFKSGIWWWTVELITVSEWYKHFKSFQKLWENVCCSGCTSTPLADEKISAVISLEHWFWWLTEWEMVEDIGISVGLCFTILTKNGELQRVCKIYSVTPYGWRKREAFGHIYQPFAISWREQEFHEISYVWQDIGLHVWCHKMKQQSSLWKAKSSSGLEEAWQDRLKANAMHIVFFTGGWTGNEKVYQISTKSSVKNTWNFSRKVPSFFTMAMLLCTWHSPSGSFTWNTNHWWPHSHSAALLFLQQAFYSS